LNFPVNTFHFILPTEIRYGKGIIHELPVVLKEASVRRVMLITDTAIRRQPFCQEIINQLKNGGIEVHLFDGVEANPKDHNVEEAARLATDLHVEALVALGGGSPIDCAKAVGVVASHGGSARTYEDRNLIVKPTLPLYTIPTTAGTGSEVTFSSVITDSRERFKFTIKSPAIAPKIAFIDPTYTHSMPAGLTAATGLDALTHAIEAFTAKVANPLSDAAALYAIERIDSNLKQAVFEGENAQAREAMMTGSLLAGIAFSHSDVASVHCIAEALGGKYDAPHGVCNAIALPVVMEYNLAFAAERYARVAKAMGFHFSTEQEGAEMAVRRVQQLAKEIGLPEFRSLGVRPEDLDELAEHAMQNGSNRDNPRPMEKSDYLCLLKTLMNQK